MTIVGKFSTISWRFKFLKGTMKAKYLAKIKLIFIESTTQGNVIYLIDIFFSSVFENKERIVLVIEYAAGGELYDYINERQGLHEEEARKFFRQITAAVYYMHSVS